MLQQKLSHPPAKPRQPGRFGRCVCTLMASLMVASLASPAFAQRDRDNDRRGPDRAEERREDRGDRGNRGDRGDRGGDRGDRGRERAQQAQAQRAEEAQRGEQQRRAAQADQQRRAEQADQQQRPENQRRAEEVDRERRANDARQAERQQRAEESRRAENQRQAERADQQRRAEGQRQERREDQQRREARDRDRDRDRDRFQRDRQVTRFDRNRFERDRDRRDWRPRGGWNRDRNFVVYRGRPVIVRPERRRVYRDIVVLRPYGHYYAGYGRFYRDDDAWRFLGLTAITFALLDAMNEAQQRALEDAQIRATSAPIGEPIYWEDGDAEGLVVTTREGRTEDGRYCREFQQEVVIGGRNEEAYGTACQQPDGSWQVVED